MSVKRKHTCNVCRGCATWGSGWQSYGSYLIEEEGLPLLKTCSDKCRAQIDDPARWLLLLWIKTGARPNRKIVKTFLRFPAEVAQLKS